MVTVWLGIVISGTGLLIVIASAILRQVVKAVRTQTVVDESLKNLSEDIQNLVKDKERVHEEIFKQLSNDRETTDRRLRYLEEFWMKVGTERMNKLSEH